MGRLDVRHLRRRRPRRRARRGGAFAGWRGLSRTAGPDAEGFYVDGPAALGHRRLSILDLGAATSRWCATAWRIVFNGEIYDFAALRDELRGKGHPFTTRSDTEVVLRAYLEWGEEFAERVHGMFALALWDAPRAQARPRARPPRQEAALLFAQRGSAGDSSAPS